MSFLPIVFGLGEAEAAAAIGISATKFRSLVAEKRNAVAEALGRS
jgi:predicted DNA-binding protein (UPF0251 family)